jgi:hypothetical protein
MNKFLTSFALIFLLVTLNSLFRTANAAPQPVNNDRRAVYAAVIEKLFAGNKVTFDTQSPVRLLVIRNRTLDENHPLLKRHEYSWEYTINQLSPISPETIFAYKAQNKESSPLKDPFNLKIKHVLVEDELLSRILKGGRWEEFYQKYPDSGGFISFSQVGFNSEMNQALVYFEHWCQSLCGSGIYVLLDKGKDGWKVTKRHRSWIS